MAPKPEKQAEAQEALNAAPPEAVAGPDKPDELVLLSAQVERDKLGKELGPLSPLQAELQKVLGADYTGDRKKDFYSAMRRLAESHAEGIPWQVMTGQAILEAGAGGSSQLCDLYLNPFGRKAARGQAATPALATSEGARGEKDTTAEFCRFDSLEAAVREQAAYIRRQYPRALRHGDEPEAFLRAMLEGGYATLDADEYVKRVEGCLSSHGDSLKINPAEPQADSSDSEEDGKNRKAKGDLEKAWDSIKEFSGQTWDGLKKMGTSLWDGLKSVGTGVLTALGLEEYFLKEDSKKEEKEGKAPAESAAPAAPREERRFSSNELLDPDATAFTFPSSAHPVVTSRQGHRNDPKTGEPRFHDGYDMAVPKGTLILATQEGEVVDRNVDNGSGSGPGNSLTVKAKDGNLYTYHHMLEAPWPAHTKIVAGMVLGKVASTGHSTGPHLHFKVQNAAGKLLNPEDFLPDRYRA